MAAPGSRTSCRTPSKLSELVSKLRNNSSNNLQVYLREIQSVVRKSKGLDIACDFRKLGGLDEVVKAVQSCSDVVADDDSTVNVLDLALSVLATCCREQETKTRVHELGGIPAIVGVLKLGSHISIINRASRALANLATTPKLSAAIHNTDSVCLLVKSLKEINDSNCQQSILRTLRLLADTSQHAQEILQAKALLVTLSCLDSDDVKLVGCAAHAAAELTSHLGSGQSSTETLKACLEAGKQAVEENGVNFLVTLLSHTKPSIQEHSLMALLNLMASEEVRVAVGRAGGVNIFIDRGKDTTIAAWPTYIHCLCYCCREAINRVRVRDLEGLDVLLCTLKNSNEDCKKLHETILVALMEFYYDEQSLNYLAVCGFIKVLVSQLKEDQKQSVVDSIKEENTTASLMKTISDKKRATSSTKCNSEESSVNLFEGVTRKRLAPQNAGLFKKFCGAKKLSSQQTSDIVSSMSAMTKAKTHSLKSKMMASSSKPEGDEPIPQTSVSFQEARGNSTKELQSSLSHSLGESGMSPPSSFTNYQLYVNPEVTAYSPPRINWEHFLKHREQTGQDLSPRSFSSFSSPLSLSPRGDLSPPASPGWFAQWSPQQSPQHLPQQWSSPVYSGDWSPQQDLQWSPQHSPQWQQEESSSAEKNKSPVTGYPTQKLAVSADLMSDEQTQENLLDPVMVELPSKQLTQSLSKETNCANEALEISPFGTPTKPQNTPLVRAPAVQAVSNLTDAHVGRTQSLSKETNCANEALEISPFGTPTKPQNTPLVRAPAVQAVSNLTDAHVGSQHPQSVKKSLCSLSKKLDKLEFHKNREISPKLEAFREPKVKNPKIKSGKSKTTSTSPKSPCLDNLGSELLYCKAERDSKFDADMEIRRAKEKGKLRRRGYAVVTLLSRYSHMDDPSSTMAKKSVISALMNYQQSSDYLQSKCQRILQRILKNRLCFEQLILEHVPLLIVTKMLNREKNEKDSPEEGIGQDVIKKNHSLNSKNVKTGLSSVGSESFSVEKLSPQSRDLKRPGGVQKPCSTIKPPELKTARHISSKLDAKSITDSVDDSASDNTSICSMDTLESERLQSLGDPASPLYHLMVSTCQYRQGLMVKLLLSESLNEKMACILAVPYICQSNMLKNKLLIKYRGLQILMNYLQKGNIIPDMFNKAVQCLRDLASTLYLSPYLSVSMNSESPVLRMERSVYVTNVTKEPERLSKESVLQPKTFGVSSVFKDADLSLPNDVILENDKFSKSADESPSTKMEVMVGHSPAEVCTSSGGLSKPNKQSEVEKRKAKTIPCLPDQRSIQEVETCQSNQMQLCSFDSMQLDVQFLLDKEDTVDAHRDTLIRSSEYFSCLLEGPYIESGQKTVPIGSISKDALTFILHTLHGCLHTQCSYLRDVLTNGCNVLLESIACAGRFLLMPVQNLLCDILVEEFLDSTTVSSHYSFGLAHNCSKLTEACLLYMLTNGQVSPKHFQDLAESSCADIAFQSIKKIVADGLVQRI